MMPFSVPAATVKFSNKIKATSIIPPKMAAIMMSTSTAGQ